MTAPATPVSANPFLALRPFRREDSTSFFGRDADLILIQSRLFSSRCTLLFAASGVGKSSFLDAKLGPAVESHWQIVTHRSWATQPPLDGLRASIAAQAAGTETFDLVKQCATLIAAPGEVRGCLVVLDQFEEVFQHWRDSKALDAFASEVARLVHAPGLEARVLISMREEFLGELSLFDNLIPDLFNNCYRLKNATQAEAEEIITRTAKLRGADCGPGLDPLLEDLVSASSRIGAARGSESAHGEESPHSRIPMPFLQIVCYRLWQQQMMRPGAGQRFLEQPPGPVRGELEAYCREKLQALSPAEQDLASAAFGFLMTRSGAKMAYPIDVLAQQAHVSEGALLAVLKRLAAEDVRLLRDIPAGPNAKPWFELYHDLYARFLSEWKREHDATRQTQAGRKSRLTVGALMLVSVLVVGALTWWRVSNENVRGFREQLLRIANDQRTHDEQETPLSIRLKVESLVRGSDQARKELRAALQGALIETGRLALSPADLIAVSPNGQVLCTVNSNGITLSRLPGGKEIGIIERYALVSAVAFSPDSSKLAAVGWDGKIEIVSTTDAKPSGAIDVLPGGLLNGVAFSADGALVAASGDSSDDKEHVVRVYSIAAPARPPITISHRTPVSVMMLSPDGRNVLSGSDDGAANVTLLRPGVFAQTGHIHQTKVIAAAFRADSSEWATASVDGIALATQINGSTTELVGSMGGSTNALAFSPKHRYLATGQGVVWDLASGKEQPLGIGGSLTALAFTPDEQYLAAAGSTGAFVVATGGFRDASPLGVLARLSEGENVRSMTLGPQGDWLAIAVGGSLRMFRLPPTGLTLPTNDRDLELLACKTAGTMDSQSVAGYLGNQPLLGCREQ